ncbi:heavy-metal-associated domain-containing protein [Leucobacter massiliensis]|uniref:Heavy metal transporter n=1 Tax=Leucobacter massiliensis TaxID=1686285 RepID=A0A2S9QNE6_9MICO|nr:heavy-metal-associated domain-containing protein [Leucobacter massiliensis]PRI11108.1 heavy metal transporter [Leucobacter massiliensis]
MPTSEYQVTGMSCGHCENAIRAEVEQIPGVTGVSVSSDSGRLSVTVDGGAVEDEAVLAAVEEAGYTASPAGSR